MSSLKHVDAQTDKSNHLTLGQNVSLVEGHPKYSSISKLHYRFKTYDVFAGPAKERCSSKEINLCPGGPVYCA